MCTYTVEFGTLNFAGTPAPPMISSPSNPRLKEVAKLREGRHRRRTGCFLIDGRREVERAIHCGIRILELFVTEEVRFSGIPTTLVAENIFDKIAFGDRNDGILAVAETPQWSLDTFPTTALPLLAVLEGIEKPGNVGAVFRSVDGAGLDGILVTDPATDLFNPNTIRSSLGTIFKVPTAVTESCIAFDWLRRHGIHLAVARCDGAIPYTDYDFRRPTAIILGSEADGLTDVWNGPDTTAISLPMHGIADSLNVSTAAAVLFYEARRHRDS